MLHWRLRPSDERALAKPCQHLSGAHSFQSIWRGRDNAEPSQDEWFALAHILPSPPLHAPAPRAGRNIRHRFPSRCRVTAIRTEPQLTERYADAPGRWHPLAGFGEWLI